MSCAKCGATSPAAAAFCMQCGAPLAVFSQGTNLLKPWHWAIASLLALCLALFVLRAAGVLAAWGIGVPSDTLSAQGAQPNSDLLKAQGSQGSDILSARGSPSGVPLDARGSRKTMPPEIRAWLEHLERIEKKRGELSGEQLSSAIVSMTELQLGGGLDAIKAMIEDTGEGEAAPSPAETTKKDFESFNSEWRKLSDEFESYPPPAECVPIRDEYRVVLSETGSMIVEIVGQIQNAEADPKAAVNVLSKMKGTSDGRIGTPSRSSDRLVGDICRKYDTSKWFAINADFGGGMFGKLGL